MIKNNNGEIQYAGDAIITGDWHIPQHSEKMLKMVIDMAKSTGIKTLVLNGDTLNMDSFSSFVRKQTNASWKIEQDVARKFFDKICKVFDKIICVIGNHEKRISRKTDYHILFGDVLNLLIKDKYKDKIIVTERDYIIINNKWRICHPRGYRKRIGSLVKSLCKRYGQNIIAGHQHYLSYNTFAMMESTDPAIYIGIDGGCCLDPEQVEYSQMNTVNNPIWTQGFVILKDDEAKIITEEPMYLKMRKDKIYELERIIYKPERRC
ncbi:MAG: metallophosphoesterase [Bacillota bacterium]